MKINDVQEICLRSITIEDLDDLTMITIYNNLSWEEQTPQVFSAYTLTNFDWMLDIFNRDWEEYACAKNHSFQFSVDFMNAVTPLLKRADLDQIHFLAKGYDETS